MKVKEMNKRKIGQRDHLTQVLQAAEKLFAKRGFYPTTIDDIAKEARLAKGTIYLYFDSKEDLFFSAIERKLDALLSKIEKAVKEPGSAWQRINTTIGIHLKFMEENKDFVVEKQSRYIKILTRLIQRAINEGEVKPLDARKLAVILMGIVHSLTVYWVSQKERGSLCRDASLVQEVFSQGVER